MNFKPKAENELTTFELLPRGEYGFEVVESEDYTSKEGNQSIKLRVAVYPKEEGSARYVFDYLTEKMDRKLRHFCASVDLLGKYETGTLEAIDCNSRSGTCSVDVQKDKAGKYPDKNVITDYLKKTTGDDGLGF